MAFIYDLDNEYGGRIISDADSTTAALEVKSNATYAEALKVSREILGNETVAPLVFGNISMASVPIIDFGGNFVSTASIEFAQDALGTAEKWIVVRAGNVNYGMPLFGLSTAVNGPGAY